MEPKEHRWVGRALVFLDIVWFLGWFSMSMWFIADSSVNNVFRDAARNLLFHYAHTGGLLYVLRFGTDRWDSGIPFLFALLADVEAATTFTLNVPTTHMAARITALVWAWTAVALSTCGGLWFMLGPPGPLRYKYPQ